MESCTFSFFRWRKKLVDLQRDILEERTEKVHPHVIGGQRLKDSIPRREQVLHVYPNNDENVVKTNIIVISCQNEETF